MRHHRWILVLLAWMPVGGSVIGAVPWTLDRALEYALAHNPDTQLARLRVAAALVAAPVRRAEAEADQQTPVAALRKALALPQLDSKSNSESK